MRVDISHIRGWLGRARGSPAQPLTAPLKPQTHRQPPKHRQTLQKGTNYNGYSYKCLFYPKKREYFTVHCCCTIQLLTREHQHTPIACVSVCTDSSCRYTGRSSLVISNKYYWEYWENSQTNDAPDHVFTITSHQILVRLTCNRSVFSRLGYSSAGKHRGLFRPSSRLSLLLSLNLLFNQTTKETIISYQTCHYKTDYSVTVSLMVCCVFYEWGCHKKCFKTNSDQLKKFTF